MGRIILLLLFVLAAYLVWKAFGPSTWKKHEVDQPRAIKGPDDDEEFLWNLEKERFKQRRAQEAEEENAASAANATPTARRTRLPSARTASLGLRPRPRP
ncbi:hypothetical protein ACLI1M_000317 [Corynebacterium sp. LaCa54]|uniref:hypothetical protein n=1 Tax=Corynebacterium sp. LaCa54 TaxID=3391428 RepID=UPI0039898EB1